MPQEDGKKKKDLDGIAYNVPGQAMVTLTDGKKKLYEGELPITQFGVIEYLAWFCSTRILPSKFILIRIREDCSKWTEKKGNRKTRK